MLACGVRKDYFKICDFVSVKNIALMYYGTFMISNDC